MAETMNQNGYAIWEDVFLDAECDSLLEGIHSTPRSRAGVRHLMAHPCIAHVASDPRMIRIASKGRSAMVPYRATLFEKTGRANWLIAWHQDTALPLLARHDMPGWGPWSTKGGILFAHAPAEALAKVVALRLHLDASTMDNGPLRVIPGSHLRGVISDDDVVDVAQREKAVTCVVGRGGVLAISPLLIHASSKVTNDTPRRVLHIEYAPSLEIVPGVMLALA